MVFKLLNHSLELKYSELSLFLEDLISKEKPIHERNLLKNQELTADNDEDYLKRLPKLYVDRCNIDSIKHLFSDIFKKNRYKKLSEEDKTELLDFMGTCEIFLNSRLELEFGFDNNFENVEGTYNKYIEKLSRYQLQVVVD